MPTHESDEKLFPTEVKIQLGLHNMSMHPLTERQIPDVDITALSVSVANDLKHAITTQGLPIALQRDLALVAREAYRRGFMTESNLLEILELIPKHEKKKE